MLTNSQIAALVTMGMLAILAGMCKAVMDTLQFHYEVSVFAKSKKQNWWNPSLSWNNKNTMSANPFIKWLLRNPLVLLTDAWHFLGFLYMLCWVLIIFFDTFIQPAQPAQLAWYWWALGSVSIWIIHSLSSHVFFTYIFIAKK